MLILDRIVDQVSSIHRNIEAGDVFHPHASREHLQQSFMAHVLRPMLPARFGLTLARAFSIDDATTRQDAILVQDALYSLPLDCLQPCETVYAMCEVTPYLDREHFETCLLNIASLKMLHRAKATAHDVSPAHHLGVFGARYAQLSDDKLNPYLGYVFAESGEDGRAMLAHLNRLIEESTLRPEHTPDAIFCLRDGWMISRQTRTGEAAVPRSSFAKFGLWFPDDHMLALMYVLLNLSLSQIQLRGPDLLRPLAALTRAPKASA